MAELVSNQLLLDIYGCSQDAARWRSALDHICQELDVSSAVVQKFEERAEVLRQCWTARDSTSLAHADRHDTFINNETNPRLDVQRAAPLRSGAIRRDSDRFAQSSSEMTRLRDRLHAAGLGHAIGTGFQLSASRSFSLILHREVNDARPFDEREERFLKELTPHLEQASRLSGELDRMRSSEAALGSALDRLSTGVVLCDRDRRVGWINPAAESVLAGSRELRVARERLCCNDQDDDRAFARLLADARGGAAPARARCAIVIGRRRAAPVQMMAMPLTLRAPESDPPEWIALILSRPGDVQPVAAAEVAELFGLSPAEARLTVALCGGDSVNDYALRRGISVGTARIQLKQVLAKTQTRRQSELVRQVCSSVVARAMQ